MQQLHSSQEQTCQPQGPIMKKKLCSAFKMSSLIIWFVNEKKYIKVRYPKAASPFASIYLMIMMRKQIPSRKSRVCISDCGYLLTIITAGDAAIFVVCPVGTLEYQNIVEQIWRTMALQHCVLPWVQSSAMLVCIQTFRG